MTWAAIGLVDLQQGRLADAATTLAHARTLNPEHRSMLVQEASALEALGYEARAEQLLMDAFEQTNSPDLELVLAGFKARRAIERGAWLRAWRRTAKRPAGCKRAIRK